MEERWKNLCIFVFVLVLLYAGFVIFLNPGSTVLDESDFNSTVKSVYLAWNDAGYDGSEFSFFDSKLLTTSNVKLFKSKLQVLQNSLPAGVSKDFVEIHLLVADSLLYEFEAVESDSVYFAGDECQNLNHLENIAVNYKKVFSTSNLIKSKMLSFNAKYPEKAKSFGFSKVVDRLSLSNYDKTSSDLMQKLVLLQERC